MSLSKEESRAMVLERAEEIIEDLPAQSSPAEQIGMDEIEEGAMGASEQFPASVAHHECVQHPRCDFLLQCAQ